MGKDIRPGRLRGRGKKQIVSEQKGQMSQGTFLDAPPILFCRFLFHLGRWEVMCGDGGPRFKPNVLAVCRGDGVSGEKGTFWIRGEEV